MSHQENDYDNDGLVEMQESGSSDYSESAEFCESHYREIPPQARQFREKPDGAVDPAGEAGWFLQRERLRRGETLDHVAAVTAIHPYHLEAIEFGEMSHMPARLEALEMISVYANYLGFDPEPLIQHYVQFLPKPALAPRAVHPAHPEPLSSAKVLIFGKLAKIPALKLNLKNMPGGTGGIVAGVAGAVLLFAAASWMMMPAKDTIATDPDIAVVADPMPTASTGPQLPPIDIPAYGSTDKVQTLPVPPAPPSTSATTGAAAQNGAVTAGQAGTIPEGDMDGLGALINQQAPTVDSKQKKKTKPQAAASQVPMPIPASTVAAGATAATDVVQTPMGRVYGANNPNARLVLKATGPVYVRIEDGQGQLVMTQTLSKGDIYKVPERAGLVIYAKDGGQLTYMIDGKDMGALGPAGEIVPGRSLNLDSFKS